MKQVAQRARDAQQRGYGYVKVFDHELEVLDTLPPWMTRLFMVLVRRSAYSSGQGATTYAELVKAMRPLQPRGGGPRYYAPGDWAVWRALVEFERAQIVWRNTGWSQKAGAIFFELAPRKGTVRPKSSSAPQSRTPPHPRENEQRRGL